MLAVNGEPLEMESTECNLFNEHCIDSIAHAHFITILLPVSNLQTRCTSK